MAKISPGTMTACIFAILVGLAGAYGVRQYLKQPISQVRQSEQPQRLADAIIPVAATDLTAGRTLTLNDVAIMRFSPDRFRKSQFAKLAYMRNTSQIEKRVLKNGLKKGEAFLMRLATPVR